MRLRTLVLLSVTFVVGSLLVDLARIGVFLPNSPPEPIRYWSVSEARSDPQALSAEGGRISGHVAYGTIDVRGAREVWFTLYGDGDSLVVCYYGVVPDTFRDEVEIAVEGRMRDNGCFVANGLFCLPQF